MKNAIQILQFTIQDTCLGCDVTELEKILPMMTLETVPNSPPYLQGMMNVGGTLIPVFNLTDYLQLKPFPYDLNTSILLIKTEDKSVGFIVEQVKHVFNIDKNKIQQNDFFKEKKLPYLGNVIVDDIPCLILQFHQIINEVYPRMR